MGKLQLVIGNKNYSSWSLRPWIVLKQASIPFEEPRIPIRTPKSLSEIQKFSAAGRVPVLIDDGIKVWESLAICEYIAERFPEKKLWPSDVEARAFARSISNEMHAGFQDLRKNMPMNCRKSFPGKGLTAEVQADIDRITIIWKESRTRYGKTGDFLLGHFTIADAMYAPVVFRFRTYKVKVDSISEKYMETMLSLPAMAEWLEAAQKEKEVIEDMEIYK
jgi:glutathione S-transferase